MNDLISRQSVIDLLKYWSGGYSYIETPTDGAIEDIESLPSIQPEIEYRACANAMLRMWVDNVVTDGEYNRIMAKLNAYWRKDEDETN